MIRLVIICIIITALFGCVSPYSKYYNANPQVVDITNDSRFILAKDTPKIYAGANMENDSMKLYEKGYLLIGHCSFNAGQVSLDSAESQARKVHAEIVLVYRKRTSRKSGTLSVTAPDFKTTSSSYYGDVYGYVSTLYGSRTPYVPYSVDKYDYIARFWAKRDISKISFGGMLKDINPEQGQITGSDKGVYIKAIVKGTPAYYEMFNAGDLVTRINNEEVFDRNDAWNKIKSFKGQKVKFSIIRDNMELEKSVQLR